jgi:selenide,water dikinase
VENLEKRRRVMDRSIRLGHCICDPKMACPCELLQEKDVCLCAGERLDAPKDPVRLTRLVDKAGCASKIDQAALTKILANLPSSSDSRVLVGIPAGDDAGVFQHDGNRAWVQTVDVFSPSVDDPYMFGQIAAANSVSDIYAMGGAPMTALSIVGFPIREIPDSVMEAILRGGIEKMNEAGVAVIGGHSINDKEIKAGFAVTGLVDPNRIITNAGARDGDALVLTKPIGTGIIAFAEQIDRAPSGAVDAVARSMASLNKAAAALMVEFSTHAATDVTGFGLMGHLAAMAAASGVDVEVVWDDLPLFAGVLECVAQGIVPGSVERNRDSSGDSAVDEEGVSPTMMDVCFDAQTSGGLLIALPTAEASPFVTRLHKVGVSDAAVIGRVRGTGSGRVFVRTTGQRVIPESVETETRAAVAAAHEETPMKPETNEEVPCCADAVGDESAGEAGVDTTQDKFKAFLQAVNKPGALDAYTKQAIAIALSVLAKCAPCVKMHVKKAQAKGFSQEEIDEAAWMAVSFGGAPLMVFYEEVKKSL